MTRPEEQIAAAMQKALQEAQQKAQQGDQALVNRDMSGVFSDPARQNGPKPQDEELPYLNEVDAALARMPSHGARWLSVMVGLFILCFIAWAGVTDVDEVTHAQGQVVSAQRTQKIENLEGGILQEMLVHEGQIVEKGDLLARISNEMAASTWRDSVSRALEAKASIIRLEAEIQGTEPHFPADLGEELLSGMDSLAEAQDKTDIERVRQAIIGNQQTLYLYQKQQRDTEMALMNAQLAQRKAEVEELEARRKQTARSLELALEQRGIALPLVKRGAYSRVSFLELEQKVNGLQGEIDQLAASIPRARSAAVEAEQRILSRQAELASASAAELNKRHMELTSLHESLSAGGDRVTRTELRSPVQGSIQRIHLSTVGGVVKPGEAIMEIVPLNDTLLVEARVLPADVAFLRPGQKAMVKISAYDFSIYGGLEATLEQISADTIKENKGPQEEIYYRVVLRTKATELEYHNHKLPIIPGMMAQVDILTGKKTILDYILKPVLKTRQNALRER